jgi:hypothetical protein
MLNFGKKKNNNILTLVMSEKKKHNPLTPLFKLNGPGFKI